MFFQWSCAALRSSKRLSLLVALPGRRQSPVHCRSVGPEVQPTSGRTCRLFALPVDRDSRPRSAHQRQPGRSASVPARGSRTPAVSRRRRRRRAGPDKDRKSRDAAGRRVQAASTGSRDVIGQRRAALHRLATWLRGATYLRTAALHRY